MSIGVFFWAVSAILFLLLGFKVIESTEKFDIVMVAAGLFAIYAVFGGFGALNEWLLEQPPAVTRLDIYFLQNTTNLLILLFFTASIAMPHMFHMIFHENRNPLSGPAQHVVTPGRHARQAAASRCARVGLA